MIARAVRGEVGAALPLVAFGAMTLSILALGTIFVGRAVYARMDVQRAADAAALGAAEALREGGRQADPGHALALAQRNATAAARFELARTETETAGIAEARAGLDLLPPKLVDPRGALAVAARAQALVGQRVHADIAWQIPKLVVVLDFSGSMSERMRDSDRDATAVLRESVKALLRQKGRLDVAAVFFADEVIEAEQFGPDADRHIFEKIDQHGPGGMTNTAAGLNKAHELLKDQPPDGGKFVLLVSDGQPTVDEGGVPAALERLWGDGTTLFTLHIDWSGGWDGALRQFMIGCSGTPENPEDEAYYFAVSSAADLEKTFRGIVSSIACYVPPLELSVLEDPRTMRVFLRDSSGRERALPQVADLAESAEVEGFSLDPVKGVVRLTFRSCEEVSGGKDAVVLRFNKARLIR